MRWKSAILVLSLAVQALNAQSRAIPHDARTISPSPSLPPSQHSRLKEVLKIVEQGIRKGTVEDFSGGWGAIVGISIGAGERQYFSSNQAASMLNNFFSTHRPISFEFSRIDEKGPSPYATGRLVYIHKGIKESVQIYVSFSRMELRWVITQFNIY